MMRATAAGSGERSGAPRERDGAATGGVPAGSRKSRK